jgi:hypothetical protein
MKTLLLAAALTAAGTSAALAQGSVYYGAPYYGAPYVYGYPPAYAGTYVYYGYVPDGRYGAYDESGNSVRQPSPSSTIRAVR